MGYKYFTSSKFRNRVNTCPKRAYSKPVNPSSSTIGFPFELGILLLFDLTTPTLRILNERRFERIESGAHVKERVKCRHAVIPFDRVPERAKIRQVEDIGGRSRQGCNGGHWLPESGTLMSTWSTRNPVIYTFPESRRFEPLALSC